VINKSSWNDLVALTANEVKYFILCCESVRIERVLQKYLCCLPLFW